MMNADFRFTGDYQRDNALYRAAVADDWWFLAQRRAEMATMQQMLSANAKPPRPDLTQRQIDWCRKHIPAFNGRSP